MSIINNAVHKDTNAASKKQNQFDQENDKSNEVSLNAKVEADKQKAIQLAEEESKKISPKRPAQNPFNKLIKRNTRNSIAASSRTSLIGVNKNDFN
jgi:bifunctional pyridoxal-dependent enzyme with beta-cystathionase and maltose regulon repressor activities